MRIYIEARVHAAHTPASGKRLVLFVSLILFIATWLVYANSLGNDFAFDDAFLIQNTRVSLRTPLSKKFSPQHTVQGTAEPMTASSVRFHLDIHMERA